MDTSLRDPLIGQAVDGRYRVEERIAAGGMATVYRAVDLRLERTVALKVMHPALAADASFVARFIREARAAARLDHANIVGVLDQGTDGGWVYLAMEYVAGCTLRDLLRERGALTPRAALDVLEPVLAGLAAAHLAGLVHRDVKPENVLIADDGRVKVADFGLVRGADGPTSATGSGSLLGTAAYLAPEQIDQGVVDARTDVYACGLLLYEMLTGAKPYPGDSTAQVLYAHVHHDVPPPSAAVPGLAGSLDALVARAAARAQDARPADAAALLALARATRATLPDDALDAEPPAAREPAAPAGGAVVGPEDETRVVPRVTAAPAAADGLDHTAVIDVPLPPPDAPPPVPGRPGRWRPGRRGRISLVVAVLLLVAGGLGVWYVNSGQFLHTPGVYGMSRAEAEEELRDAGLRVRFEEAFSDTVEPDHVIATDPERGERVRRNATVTVTVSRGPELVEVPDVAGLPEADAREALREAGLTPHEVDWRFSDEVPRGRVLSTDPAAGETRRPDTGVNLVVSKGPEIRVPTVVGLPEGTAIERLTEAGFEVEVAEERVHSEEEAGRIARQDPAGGATAAEGDTVTLTVSEGPEMVEVPDVTGMDQDEAEDALEAAGFEVNVNRVFFTGTVFNQSVHGGEEAPRGSTITIWVR